MLRTLILSSIINYKPRPWIEKALLINKRSRLIIEILAVEAWHSFHFFCSLNYRTVRGNQLLRLLKAVNLTTSFFFLFFPEVIQ